MRKKANVKKEQRDATGKTKQNNTKLGEAVSGDMQELRKKKGKKRRRGERKKEEAPSVKTCVCVITHTSFFFFFLFPFYLCNQALFAAA